MVIRYGSPGHEAIAPARRGAAAVEGSSGGEKPKRRVYLGGKTLAAQKPWEVEGISRRTWYRRQKEKG